MCDEPAGCPPGNVPPPAELLVLNIQQAASATPLNHPHQNRRKHQETMLFLHKPPQISLSWALEMEKGAAAHPEAGDGFHGGMDGEMGWGRDPSWGGCWRWHGDGSLSLCWISPLCPVSPLRGDVHRPVQENQHALLRISMATGTPPALLPVSSLLGRGDASVTEGTPRGRRGCSCDGEDTKKSRGSPPPPPRATTEDFCPSASFPWWLQQI